MNKNIVATTISLGMVAVAFGVFYAVTPPLKTGGLSPMKAHAIEKDFLESSPQASNLVIDRARSSDGFLRATFTSEGKEVQFITDSQAAVPLDKENPVITSSVGPVGDNLKSTSVMATMLFSGKQTPSLVFTIGGDHPLEVAGKIFGTANDDAQYPKCFTKLKESTVNQERSVSLKLNCDLRLDQVVDALSFNDQPLVDLAVLNQSFLENTGEMKYLTQRISPQPTHDAMFQKEGTISVFYKKDPGAMDRGINFAYKPKP